MVNKSYAPPPLKIREVGPDYLIGDLIQPGHPWFGLISVNRARVSGTACFFGTRVMISNLFDSLAGGESLDNFLDGYEGVNRDQVIGVLELAGRGLLEKLSVLETAARSQSQSQTVEALAST